MEWMNGVKYNLVVIFDLEIMIRYILVTIIQQLNTDALTETSIEEGGAPFFKGELHDVQGVLQDIETAGRVLNKMEGQLKTLDDRNNNVKLEDLAIETAVASDHVHNYWNDLKIGK